AQASRAETRANWLDGSRRLTSWRSRTSDGRTLASPAKVTGRLCSATQSCSRARMPDSPARRALHDSGAVPPSGELAPIPVTTIFLVMGTLLVLGQRYEGNGVRDTGRPGRAFARPGLPCITAKGSGLRLDDEVDG